MQLTCNISEGSQTSSWLTDSNDVNILCGSNTLEESTEVLVVISKGIVLEINAEKTNYLVGHVPRSERRTKR